MTYIVIYYDIVLQRTCPNLRWRARQHRWLAIVGKLVAALEL